MANLKNPKKNNLKKYKLSILFSEQTDEEFLRDMYELLELEKIQEMEDEYNA